MNITILCSTIEHPVYPYLQEWSKKNVNENNITLTTKIEEVKKGGILFLISFTKIVNKGIRDRFKHALVIHASDLPEGKGWSPYIWQILEGKNKIAVTLFEAIDKVDAGDIWKKEYFSLDGHELYDEINQKLFEVELKLMDFAIDNADTIKPRPQPEFDSPHYPKRTPDDSEIDPNKTISEQFDLMRVCDEKRFPCFFNFRNHRYKIKLSKF